MNIDSFKKLKDKIGWLPLIIVIYFIPIIFGFYYIARYAVNVPFWDQWDTIVSWTIEWHQGNFDFERLFEVQNDSRPLVSNVLMFLVSVLTDLNIKVIFYIGYAIYIISFVILIYFIKTDLKLDYPALILLVPLSFYAFNPYYVVRFFENLGAVTYPLVLLSAFITIYLIYKSKNSYPYYFSSIGMGAICTFTGAPGLTIWLAGAVQLIFQKMHRKWQKVAIWIVSAVAIFFVYYVLLGLEKEGVHSTGAYSSFLMTFVHYPLQKFLCFMGVIGSEVIHDEQIALFFGLIIFVVAIALIYVNRKFLELDRLSKWYGILTFGTLISLELTLTRSGSESLSIFGPPDTIFYIPAPRHSLAIFLPLMCIYILSIIYTINSIAENSSKKLDDFYLFITERKHLNLFLLGIISMLLLCGILLHILPGLSLSEATHNQQSENQYVLQNYAIAQDYELASLHYDPYIVRTEGAKLDHYKLSIFANPNLNSNPTVDWNSLVFIKGGMMNIDIFDNNSYMNEREIIHVDKKSNLSIELNGWAVDSLSKNGNTRTYLVFKNEDDEIIVPTIRTSRQDVANSFGVQSYINSGWMAIVPTQDFKEECYNISLRILRTNGEEYFELNGDKPICFN